NLVMVTVAGSKCSVTTLQTSMAPTCAGWMGLDTDGMIKHIGSSPDKYATVLMSIIDPSTGATQSFTATTQNPYAINTANCVLHNSSFVCSATLMFSGTASIAIPGNDNIVVIPAGEYGVVALIQSGGANDAPLLGVTFNRGGNYYYDPTMLLAEITVSITEETMQFTDVSDTPLADIELYSFACSYFAQAGPSMAVGACNLQRKSTFNQIVYLPTTESGINENPVPQAYDVTNVAQILLVEPTT
ncbi:uncharacterized protein AMSG_08953, partial [Thecamonas trahens ATCC 50062]